MEKSKLFEAALRGTDKENIIEHLLALNLNYSIMERVVSGMPKINFRQATDFLKAEVRSLKNSEIEVFDIEYINCFEENCAKIWFKEKKKIYTKEPVPEENIIDGIIVSPSYKINYREEKTDSFIFEYYIMDKDNYFAIPEYIEEKYPKTRFE